jgi:hypothetical protein
MSGLMHQMNRAGALGRAEDSGTIFWRGKARGNRSPTGGLAALSDFALGVALCARPDESTAPPPEPAL